MKHHAAQLYQYHVWANTRIIEHVKSLPQDIYCMEVQGAFSSLQEAINHIYMMDAMWLGVMSGDSFSKSRERLSELMEEVAGKDIEQMEAMCLALSQQYKAFLQNHENLDMPFTIEHPHFGRLETKRSELIQHVVNHGTYHRGQITDILRQVGHSGIPTDYIFYVYAREQG
ncbi:DinB family protein [Aneurinibacillus sp. REN35]|uniref:DinB family protein n=1 Tax=Aneurinibacillus sp. REN35 TaxID=3237286 RepID=UPI003528310B